MISFIFQWQVINLFPVHQTEVTPPRYKIEDLLTEHPELESIYIREWGRIHSRKKKQALKILRITKRWFAVYDDTILLSSISKKEIGGLIQDSKKLGSVFYFKV